MRRLKTRKDILKVIREDKWRMRILRLVRDLGLPDWWIGAGFVRNKVFDFLHGYKRRTPLNDVDVIYFDKKNLSEMREIYYQNKLKKKMPRVKWSVTNQARMHKLNGDKPYKNAEDGLARWTETPTCIGVRLGKDGRLLALAAPHGIKDLVNLLVRPGPLAKHRLGTYAKRMKEKNWQKRWPKIRILDLD
ncbi:MAG: nucleotidyltransferase family protein [DPANN group archaeon]|nr:nucleotidyltransferase family protein [DPANN group archaeon]